MWEWFSGGIPVEDLGTVLVIGIVVCATLGAILWGEKP